MKQIYTLKEPTNKILNANTLFDKIKDFNINYNQENFILFVFDTKQTLIHSEVLFKGGLNCCMIDPKTIFRTALIKNGNTIIIAHNHPSDSLTPSQEDKQVFKKLIKIGDYLQLKVLDSIIFNKFEYFSLLDGGF